MGLSASAIAERLQHLLPRGVIWVGAQSRVLHRLLLAAADECARLYARAQDLLMEAHPHSITETVDEWEDELGLPLPCAPAAQTLEDRRLAIAARLRAVGGQSIAYFTEVAAALGVTISIVEESPFYVGFHGCGDPIGEIAWAYAWTVTAPDVDSAALVSCVLSQIKPAHTYLIVISAT